MQKINDYSRRLFLKQSAMALTTSLLAGCTCRCKTQQPQDCGCKPNVLFIAVDDLRTQLGCYGKSEIISPNIDKLASQGVLFSRAYCQVPVCGASRASLLTGIRPDYAARRFTTANTRADEDAPHAITLPQHFKENGYQTISIGKVFHYMQDSPQSWTKEPQRLFDYDTDNKGDWAAYNFNRIWVDPESKNHISEKGRGPFCEAADVPDDAYEDGKLANKVIEDLRMLKQQDSPFFLACGFAKPHLPFNSPQKYWDLYDPQKLELAPNRFAIVNKPGSLKNSSEITSYSQIEGWPDDEAFHRKALHGYYACVSYVDAQIGRVLDELASLGLDKNTIVVLWGDHGWLLGEHNFWGKHNTLNEALQVPLIVRAPNSKAGARTSALVEFVDLYPTLCEIAGLPGPQSHKLEGKSFVLLLKNPNTKWKEAAYSEWTSGRAVKTNRYLYTEWKNGEKMLFDHIADPQENVNIADYPQNKRIVATHSELLKTMWP